MSEVKQDILRQHAKLKSILRDYFESDAFLEVSTPILVKNPGLEPHIRYFKTEFEPDMGQGQKHDRYLITSPEYHLKKILGWGLPKIFEITKAFRNGELSKTHEPEFQMLEWYRNPGSLNDIAADIENLFKLLKKNWPQINFQKLNHIYMIDLWSSELNVDLEYYLDHKNEFVSKMIEAGHLDKQAKGDSFIDAFNRIFVSKLELKLNTDQPVLLWGFPAEVGALSKRLEKNVQLCDRFELYWKGLEIANAFNEITDETEFKNACLRDLNERAKYSPELPKIDTELLNAHKSFSKPMAGVAMGLDRLLMALLDKSELKDILAFSQSL